jgi:hypothetical protein
MMQTTRTNKALSLILCMVLIAAMALFSGCGSDKADPPKEGEKSFTFTVADLEGNEKSFEITTDAATVGEALLEEKLIAGEDSQYGLYVKTVNGITLDYNKDGAYWSFYVGNDYAMSGVDTTEIEDGQTYSFRAEKG